MSTNRDAQPISFYGLMEKIDAGTAIEYVMLFYKQLGQLRTSVYVRFVGRNHSYRVELPDEHIATILAATNLLGEEGVRRVLNVTLSDPRIGRGVTIRNNECITFGRTRQ